MKNIIQAVLCVFIMVTFTADINAQATKINPRRKIVKRVAPNKVVYKKQKKKMVAVRVLPGKARPIIHRGQTYHYVNNRFYRYNAGRYLPVKPVIGLRIRTLPVGFRIVVFNNRNFYVADGVYYAKRDNEYEVIEPEIGAVVYQLPSNNERIEINGMHYYEYNNVIYEKIQIDGTRAYEIVGMVGNEL